ncbi:MAG: hypothetical protein KatS3mg132_718 [Limisphaera sp.]|nr:MAG: hypothetical protein KatS3mg132_718 [Limisphaera sp.]
MPHAMVIFLQDRPRHKGTVVRADPTAGGQADTECFLFGRSTPDAEVPVGTLSPPDTA